MTEDEKKKLIPAVVQDWRSGEVLMLAYMDDEALRRTLADGTTWFWSRGRQEYWHKGDTSGHRQIVKELRYDCDDDAYLVLVEQVGDIACHTGNRSCFYRSRFTAPGFEPRPFTPPGTSAAEVLAELFQVIKERQREAPAGSYTVSLLKGGLNAINAKISEESAEVVEAAAEKDKGEIIWEVGDLIYHLLVLLAYKEISLEEIAAELSRRRKPKK